MPCAWGNTTLQGGGQDKSAKTPPTSTQLQKKKKKSQQQKNIQKPQPQKQEAQNPGPQQRGNLSTDLDSTPNATLPAQAVPTATSTVGATTTVDHKTSDSFFDVKNLLPFAVVGLFSLFGIIVGSGAFLFAQRQRQSYQTERETQKKQTEQLSASHTRAEETIAALEERLQQLAEGKYQAIRKQDVESKQFSARLLQIEEQVEALQQQLATMARAAMRAAESAAVATRPTAYAESRRPAAPVAPPETFPVLLHEYLQRKNAEAKAPRFRVAMHGGLESYEGGSLLIIAEGADFLALPSQSRFESSDDFQTVRSFYDCQNPASGEVVLHHPARVRPDATGRVYHLVEKGEISIRR